MVEHQVQLSFILLVVYLVGQGICEKDYVVVFNDGFGNCKDFDNTFFKGDSMVLGKTCDDGGDSMYLQGCLELSETAGEGIYLNIDVDKETEVGSEPMWSCSMDLCKSLQDKDAPWAEAMKTMNITECPIEKGIYCCEKLVIDLDFAKSYMQSNFEGTYGAKMKLTDAEQKALSCHTLGLSVMELE